MCSGLGRHAIQYPVAGGRLLRRRKGGGRGRDGGRVSLAVPSERGVRSLQRVEVRHDVASVLPPGVAKSRHLDVRLDRVWPQNPAQHVLGRVRHAASDEGSIGNASERRRGGGRGAEDTVDGVAHAAAHLGNGRLASRDVAAERAAWGVRSTCQTQCRRGEKGEIAERSTKAHTSCERARPSELGGSWQCVFAHAARLSVWLWS